MIDNYRSTVYNPHSVSRCARLITLLSVVVLLPACGFFGGLSKPGGVSDSAPNVVPDNSKISDAVPRVEPKSRGGNRSSYKVFGKTYKVMNSSKGFVERGDASWYGTKFHGRLTANGERYDMYAMTAAHKNLPLPSYVQVTNLDNGKKIVVRVNDRGPFHKGRVIDLSYAAASKIGMLKKGTARVKVVAIDPRTWGKSNKASAQVSSVATSAKPSVKAAVATPIKQKPIKQTPVSAGINVKSSTPQKTMLNGKHRYLQVAAYQSLQAAQAAQNRLLNALQTQPDKVNVVIHPTTQANPLYRVRLGPLSSLQGSQLASTAVLQSFGKILTVYE